MVVIRQWFFERFRFFFVLGLLGAVYKITEACACTAQMYGINLPFLNF